MEKDEKTKTRSRKNEWMDNPYLLEAAVEAVEKGYTHLSWRSTFSRGWNRDLAWREYKCAAAWVRRENLKKQAEAYKKTSRSTELNDMPARYKNIPKNSPDTPAAIALAKVVAQREQEEAEREKYICRTPPRRSFEDRMELITKDFIEFAKGFPKQVLLIFAIIPFVVIFGGSYHSGLLVTFMPVLIAIGVAILVFRYIRVLCISLFTGRPMPKDWHK